MTERSSHSAWFSNHKFYLGYTDSETVMVDFDTTPFKTVKYWASRAMAWFRLHGFIILKSSPNNYHVVFDRRVSWKRNLKVIAWLAIESRNPKLKNWALLQSIKGEPTLRVSPKKSKPCPRIVYRHGKQDRQISSFQEYRRMLKGLMKSLENQPNRSI